MTLLFNRIISPAEFEEAMTKLIPDEATRECLLDVVAEIYLSFEGADEETHSVNGEAHSLASSSSENMMTSSTIDIFIAEVHHQRTTHTT